MTDIRTNSSAPVVLEDNGRVLYVSVVEHYEVIDPDLPYDQRFATHEHRLQISGDDGEEVSIPVNLAQALDLTNLFASSAGQMLRGR